MYSISVENTIQNLIMKLDNNMVQCTVSPFLFHTVDLPTGQGLQLVDVERLAIGLVRLAPLHLDQLRRPWPALRVEAEGKVLSGVLRVAHQLNFWNDLLPVDYQTFKFNLFSTFPSGGSSIFA